MSLTDTYVYAIKDTPASVVDEIIPVNTMQDIISLWDRQQNSGFMRIIPFLYQSKPKAVRLFRLVLKDFAALNCGACFVSRG